MKLLLAFLLSLVPSLSVAQALDYNIENQTFPAFRADLNAHLGAIVQQNAGASAPATTFPYMAWADTSAAAPVIRYRNAANAGWAAAFRIDPSSTMWLGGITTSAATITGGSINGTTVGATTASSGRFTGNIIESTVPFIRFIETDGAATHNRTVMVQEANVFQHQTVSASNTFVSTDYTATKGASGTSAHVWSVNNAPMLEVLPNGVVSRGWFLATGPSASEFRGDVNVQNGRHVFPQFTFSTAQSDLGTPSNGHWRNLYLQNAPIVFSDARLKHDAGEVTAAECRVADRIQLRRYKLNDGDGKWRFGVLAQEVIAAFEAEGLDWQDYHIVAGSAEHHYSVVYDELQSLKLACM